MKTIMSNVKKIGEDTYELIRSMLTLNKSHNPFLFSNHI